MDNDLFKGMAVGFLPAVALWVAIAWILFSFFN